MTYHDLLNAKRPMPPGKETTCPTSKQSSPESLSLLDSSSTDGASSTAAATARETQPLTSCERTAERPSGDKETAMSDSANVDPWVTFRPAGESTMADAAKFLRPLCGVCSKAEDPSKLLGTCEECRAQATGGTSGYTAVEVDANAGKWTPASIPDLVARVQALEARVDAISFDSFSEDTSPAGSLATILGKRDDETIEDAANRVVSERDYASKCGAEWSSVCHEIGDAIGSQPGENYVDAARRVVAERDERSAWAASVLINEEIGNIIGSQHGESYVDAARRVMRRIEGAEDAFNRVQAERNAAVKERDEAVRLLHQFFSDAAYPSGKRWVSNAESRPIVKVLARHGLATDHGDGTFTLLEPKP